MELTDERVDKYTVSTIIENIFKHIDDQGCDTWILEEIVAFRSYPDVAIPTGDQ